MIKAPKLVPILGAIALVLVACAPDGAPKQAVRAGLPAAEASSQTSGLSDSSAGDVDTTVAQRVLTLGDIDPDDPVKKIERFQPLADYLAQHLQDFGIDEGRVVIARDMEEMATFLEDGTVDVYFDSAFPTIVVQDLAQTEVIARRWKQGGPTYFSMFIALRDNGVSAIGDFVGKVVAFEEPYSTSGYVLPAGTLIQGGFSLTEVETPEQGVAPDQIGYVFTGDEQDTIALLERGAVAGAGISNQDYEELPPGLREELVVLESTMSVPRQLVSVRPGLDEAVVGEVRELLFGLDHTALGQRILESLKKTAKFDPVSEDTQVTLRHFNKLVDLVAKQ